jgi:hypothetical protein
MKANDQSCRQCRSSFLLRKQSAKGMIKSPPIDLVGQRIQWMASINDLFQARPEQVAMGLLKAVVFCLHKFAGF